MHVVVSVAPAVQSGWFGIESGDWLTAITNMLAIIIAVVIAANVAPKAQARSARRDQRERLLRILIATSALPANPEYQGAIAMIPVDFKGNTRVLNARARYLETVNVEPPTGQDALTEHFRQQNEAQSDLIAIIADELDFDLTKEALRKGAYISKGFIDREQLQIEAMRAWPRIAAALEDNNRILAATIGKQAPPPTELQ